MRLRTKGYLIIVGIIIILEILMIAFYVQAANEFEPYQLYDILNFTRDNDFENGIVFLFLAIMLQLSIGIYLVLDDRRMIKK